MNLYFFDDNNIITFTLPIKRIGDFWMTDSDGKNIVNIKAINNSWYLSSSENTKLLGNTDENGSISLTNNTLYTIEKNEKKYILFVSDIEDNTFTTYNIASGTTLKIGNDSTCDVFYNNNLFLPLHFSLIFQNNDWKIIRDDNARVYVNNTLLEIKESVLKNGDVINVYGNKLVLISNMIFINNPQNNVRVNQSLNIINLSVTDDIDTAEVQNENLYKESDYFLKSPRLRKTIEPLEMKIDSPPSKENIADTPLWVMLAPMLTMAASSVISVCSSITSLTTGERTLKEVLPTLIISIAMILTTCVWPFITKKLEKNAKIKREEERQTKYKRYLDTKKDEIVKEYETQKKILEENLLSTDVCYDSIINKRRTLWERKRDQGDFLTVRVGKGKVPFSAKINYHVEDFSMDDDNLKKMLDGLIKGYEILDNVPVAYSFSENNKTAVNGIYPKYIQFMNNILLQMISYHSYDDLKIVIFTNKKNQNRWEYLKEMPYCFSDDKMIRFFATTTEEMQDISNYLETVYNNRKTMLENIGDDGSKEYSKFSNYYLVIIDDIDLARKINIVDSILEEKRNYGFSTIIIEEKLSKLPSEVTSFITIGESTSMIMKSDDSNQVRFTDEITNYDMSKCSKIVSNLPIYIENSQRQLPSTISFLEMFGVGQIEQLNVINRWKENDPTKSLKTEIGINENGDDFILDLHEKQHGPHGLIAGMTGSGKSEFIISYILSMAINYSPEEVAFVLIDYKGGGLAGAFVNSTTGEKLPHVVGTITNLDKTEINRALASINSELRRRQEKFNEIRDKMGESTIDIYKYQRYYRDGSIDEPIPHLVIVCDEFAELKTQQPDFMEDLISTARIGRSLGVHLILATQKPSGVVDAQIWSNSKFKICLKVQDKSDSMEMIKNDLAAELKNVGRFYLQVGYNEYFAMGQAAWAGAKYYPSKEFKKPVDKNIYFIDNIGNIKKSIFNSAVKNSVKSEGEELTCIVKYLIGIGEEVQPKTKQLWLDRIPNQILINNLIKKYNFNKSSYILNPVIGEYDDPTNQSQNLLTLPLSSEGNAIIYGMPDSGKDEFLQSLVYSTIITYSTNEVNMYLMDYGAETLINYNDAPQVGDVILNGDDEKAENLVKMLMSEISKRKKLFLSYNGNYQDYIKTSTNKIPNILVIINGMEVLTENNPEYVDKLVPIVREGAKYGIHFVITASTQSSVKFKISQSCKLQLCLQMNNPTDYRDILGKTDGLVPFNTLGRGLVKLEKVCEFQTASISEDDKKLESINSLIGTLNANNLPKARKIPVMPDIITLERFNGKYKDITTVPLGLTRDNLTASLYNFSKNTVNLISSMEIDNMKNFINNFVRTVESNDTFDKIVIDACNFFDTYNYNSKLINSNFSEGLNLITNIDNKNKEILSKNNMNVKSLKNERNLLCIIIGLDKFLSKLSDEEKTIFKELLSNNKDINKINFVFIDVPSSFKKYEFEEWFKNTVNCNEGIFIGTGITQQYTIKLNIQPMGIATIENDYAVVVKNAMPTVIKLINEKININ